MSRGAAPNEFLLVYGETRRLTEGDTPKSLKSVEVRLGGKTIQARLTDEL